MEEIELVIKIPKEIYQHYKKVWQKRRGSIPESCIAFGTPATLTQRWIPVHERLPNLDDFSGPKVWQKEVLITGYISFDDTKELFVSEAFAEDVIFDRVPNTVVVAWMPLPKPFDSQEK